MRSSLVARTAATLIVVLAAVAVATVSLTSRPASAAALTPVTGFGSNPGALQLYSYLPDGLGTAPALVVALHGCTQSAADYHASSGWRKYADLWKFVLLYPQQTSANNGNSCFNWFLTGDTTRGQGEALSIRQMVNHAVTAYGVDPRRVFVTGLSAGGAMTSVMLATYPDVFAGGSVVAGVAYRCATDLSSAISCQYSAQTRTPRQWGDLVRAAHPGYSGARPVVSIWHGSEDRTVIPANATQSRDQWTDVAGVSQTPTSRTTLPDGTVVERHGTAVTRYQVPGIGHGTPVDPGSAVHQCGTAGTYYLDSVCSAYHDAVSFGLSGTTPPPTTTTGPTTTTAPPAPCFTSNNWDHVAAGRAHQVSGQVYANGSNQAMGLWNTYVTHTLRRTATNYYVLADGEC